VLRRIFAHKREKVTEDWKNLYKEVHHRFLFFMKCSLNDEIKKDQMVEAFSTLWRYVKGMPNFNKNVMGNDLLGDPGERWRIILKWCSKLKLYLLM
jgi:hypothetical protein